MDEEPDVITVDEESGMPNVTHLRPGADGAFPISKHGTTAAILRWLRLITLYQVAISSLVYAPTLERLLALSLKVIKISMPQGHKTGGSIRPSEAHNTGRTRSEVLRGGRNLGDIKTFGRTFHCEAILLSLFVMCHDNATHIGVSEDLKQTARTFFPHVLGVSKRCCPVCAELCQVMSRNLKDPVVTTGTHSTYTPCCLPPFRPKVYAEEVATKLQALVKEHTR
jgi:hypothetical protein